MTNIRKLNWRSSPREMVADLLSMVGAYCRWPHDRLIITATRCLAQLPPCDPASYLEDRIHKALLAPLGGEPSLWAQ